MTSSESVLTQFILMLITFIVLFYICCFMIKRKFPFTKISKTYTDIKSVIRYGLRTVFLVLFAIIVTAISYHLFKLSLPNLSDFKNDEVGTLFIMVFAIMITSLNWNALLSFGKFLEELTLYFSLKKNNIKNNLHHALANRDEQAIIENHKLISQADTKINLSNDEILVLTATLSKKGYHEDVKKILDQYLYKKQSFLSKILMSNPNAAEHSVEGLDRSFSPSESFKHKLRSYEKIAINISKLLIVVFVIQIVFLMFCNMFNISSAISSIVPIFINLLVIVFIIMKHVKLKKIYIKEIVFNNLSTSKVKIRRPFIDNILLGISLCMLFINIFELLI
ncbi:hypothetical protein APV47_12780 [Staphylococcus aureus]|uniref:Uncharacterized protein n=2 Tax=Staphylococcus TaxID=1279 RepID=A0A0D4ZYE5_STAEP|nr:MULTISPECIES: hypothetical protein [Staphylococcus]MDY3360375.1 hypothetical protein [Clostridium celatum]AJW29184.1 hypothetical protein [Staphylococcus epidermidis]ARA73655.1 hypothetical protein [Staphylococcus epidermidis]KZG49428.1 hypothetical protein A4U44_00435 [Staphylococcus epidermidis]KZG55037.1 hypothetical protein A0W31_03820 [Staphylococcus epidermidis]